MRRYSIAAIVVATGAAAVAWLAPVVFDRPADPDPVLRVVTPVRAAAGGIAGAGVGAAAIVPAAIPDATAPTTPPATAATAPPATAVPTLPTVPAAPTTAPEPTIQRLARPVVVLYGDSLGWEARHGFARALEARPDLDVHQRSHGGTAICDWMPAMADDVVQLHPGMVVVQFSGNSFTECVRDAAGRQLTGPPHIDRYEADARAVIELFRQRDVEVVLAGSPIPAGHTASSPSHIALVNERYQALADEFDGVDYADAAAAVLADDGTWTDTLPCLPIEPCERPDGRTVVRSPDGLHFCPVLYEADRGVTGDCPVWASGAHRFGHALAQPILDRL